MKKILILLLTTAFFAGINFAIYKTVTSRVGNNFSGATQIKMIDVRQYLPFEEGSALAHTDTDLKIEGYLPKLDGAAALVPIYASVIDNIYPEGCVTYEGGVFDDDNYYGENFAEGSAMQYKNTVRGFEAVVNGDTDIFLTAHPSKEQMEYAKSKGVELELLPIGKEAFVFFVNKDNPVNDLTSEEIRDIYAGKITDWSEVGGPRKIINPLTRIKGSGSQTMMDRFMGDTKTEKRSPLAFLGGSIGYSFRFYLSGMVANKDVKMLGIDGINPDIANIKDGSYPLTADFYAVYRKDNREENVKTVIDFLLSDDGQDLIEQVGYAGLN